MVLSR